MSEYAIPKRTSGERILDVIQAYYRVSAHSEPVSSAKVDEMLGFSDVTGRQTSFFDSIGIVEKHGRERKLTSDGEEIAEALIADEDGDLAKERLRDLLEEWEFASEIVNFVDMRDDGVSEDQVLEYIQSNAATEDNRGMSALIDLLEWSELLSKHESGGKITTVSNPVTNSGSASTNSKSTAQPSEKTVNSDAGKSGEGKENVVPENDGATSDRIEVSFEFSADDAPSEIEATIRAARRALEEDLE